MAARFCCPRCNRKLERGQLIIFAEVVEVNLDNPEFEFEKPASHILKLYCSFCNISIQVPVIIEGTYNVD